MELRSHEANPAKLESWIDAARRGDREALGRALHAFREYLLLVAREEMEPSLTAKAGASDVVQDTFFQANRGFAAFRGRSESEWRAWLRMILRRSLSHQRRHYHVTAKRCQGREVSIDVGAGEVAVSGESTPSRQLARVEREAALLAALNRLPDHYREVVIAHHRERLSFDEIGRRRGISAEAARKLWTRALGRLRHELGPEHASR